MEGFANHIDLLLFGGAGDESIPSDVIPPTNETGEENTSVAGESHETEKKSFREMVEGEYKEEFTAYFNEIFNRRFKEQKGLMEELRLARAVVEAAKARYGTEEIGALPEVIRADRAESRASAEATAERKRETETRAESLDVQKEKLERALTRARLETERAMMETIRARGLRPSENALSATRSERSLSGSSHLTRAERAEVALRAAMGERISF